MNCPICSSSELEGGPSLFDDRYAYPGSFACRRCRQCGHRFLLHQFTPAALAELYSRYYPRSSFALEQYRPYTEVKGFKGWLDGESCSAFRWVPRQVRVLDIGCGFGEALGYHVARGCDVYAVEADANILRVAERYGFKVKVGVFDGNMFAPDFFDYVTLDQVIEHVTDPLKTMRDVARVLKPGGTAIISTPNGEGWGGKIFRRKWINWHTPYHLQIFCEKSFRIAAEQAGLIVQRAQTVTNSGWLRFQWAHLLLYPEAGQPSAFWAPQARKSATQWVLLKALGAVHRIKINHVVTRVFDSLGQGDNLLFIVKKPQS